MTNLRKLIALPAAERRLLIQAALLTAMVRLALWTLPLRTIYRALERLLPAGPQQGGPPPRVSWAVGVGSACVPHATCLTQALVAHALLRSRGLPGVLLIGVARGTDGAFEAHAWVESEGHVVVGGPADRVERYRTLPDLVRFLGTSDPPQRITRV